MCNKLKASRRKGQLLSDDWSHMVEYHFCRTATIETSQDFCHFLRIGKKDFNRIFRVWYIGYWLTDWLIDWLFLPITDFRMYCLVPYYLFCSQDVETNTVRLKEHGQDVLVLEKMNIRTIYGQNGNQTPQK